MSNIAGNYISTDDSRKYTYANTSVTLSGVADTYTGYPFQVINIQPNDVILLRVADNLSLKDCKAIQKEMEQTFPENTVVLCNDHILKGITVLRGETEKINDTVDIKTTIDIDKLFNEIMRGNPNDFLY